MRKSRCKECGGMDESVGLRWVDSSFGYVNLHQRCVGRYKKKAGAVK